MQDATLRALQQVCDDLDRVTQLVRQDTDQVLASGDHIAVIKHYDQTRKAVEKVKESREAIKGIEDTLNRTAVPDIINQHREKTGQKPPFYIEGVGRVSVGHRYSCSMLDKEMGIVWLKTRGYGEIVQETVNSQTLSSFAKKLLEDDGKELPDDLFKVGTMAYTSITKAG